MDLTNDDMTAFAMYKISDKTTEIRHQTDSFSDVIDALPGFIETEFKQEREYIYETPLDGIAKIEYGLVFKNVQLKKPLVSSNSDTKFNDSILLYPDMAKKSNKTYENFLYANVHLWMIRYRLSDKKEYVADPIKRDVLENKLIGSIPVLVKSKACNLYGMPKSVQREIDEDPEDPGGYFIIDGQSKVMYSRKNSAKNVPILTMNSEGIIMCKFTSKPGDKYERSKYLEMELHPHGHLLIRLTLGKNLTITFPFYIAYYLFGLVTDGDILNSLIPNYNPNNEQHFKTKLMATDALVIDYMKLKKSISDANLFPLYDNKDITNTNVLALILAEIINKRDESIWTSKYSFRSDIEKQNTINNVLNRFDENIFPHIGITREYRLQKLDYLSNLIWKMYGIKLGDAPTDRNSLINISVYNTGPGYISLFKSVFNITVTSAFSKKMKKILKTDSNPIIKTIYQQSITPVFLGKTLSKGLKAGNKPSININQHTQITSRINTTPLDITNKMSAYSNKISVISNPNSMSGRSNEPLLEFRGTHPTFAGVLDPLYCIEGDKAGLTRAMTLISEITDIIYSDKIIKIIMEDINNQEGKIPPIQYSSVIINGKPLGKHYDTAMLADKYRQMRLEGKLNRNISIIYKPLENGELHIDSSIGRMIRPFIKVYHNYDKKSSNFKLLDPNKSLQYIKLTHKHILDLVNKKIKYNDLIEQGLIEMITTNEYENIIVAKSIDYFNIHKNNKLMLFTHVDIPIGNLGLQTLTGPFPQCAQLVRNAYQAKFTKQTMGLSTVMYDKIFPVKLPISHQVHRPIVKTISDRIYLSGGATLMVSISCKSNNEEDSTIISRSLAESGKLDVLLISSINIEPKNRQVFQTPDPLKVEGTRNVDYSYLVNGLPRRGVVIEKGMVIIGLVETTSDGSLIDRSHYHNKNHSIKIDDTLITNNKEGILVARVKYYNNRILEPGDKVASRSGGKGIICEIRDDEEMDITEDGIVPELILNPHAFPSRMVINQLKEGVSGHIASHLGKFISANFFENYNEKEMDKIAKELGIDYNGERIMYSGKTGRRIRSKIFICPNYYQRLIKMAKDGSAVVNNTSIDTRTGQPSKGINKGKGSIRLGYMEIDTLIGRASNIVMDSILFKSSDRRIIVICANCGNIAIGNMKRNEYRCRDIRCTKLGTSFKKIRTTINTIKFMHYLAAMGIYTNLIAELPLIET